MAGSKHKRGKSSKLESTNSENEESSDETNVSTTDDEQEESNELNRKVDTAEASINREDYLQTYKDLTNEIKHLHIKNNILHRRLAEYYRKRQLEHVLKSFEGTRELELKYQQKLIAYKEIKEKTEKETVDIWLRVSAVESEFLRSLEHTEKKFTALQNLERNTGIGLIYSGKGKPIADKTISRFLTLQMHKSEEAAALTLRYIRVRNAVAEATVKKLESLGPDLYVHQYEQLSIDYQNYINKIEEREDELTKNRSKCTEHNQILAHIREKMHHTEEAIDFAECDLGESEIEHIVAREDLGILKSRRDKLRWSLEAERRRAGLLTKNDLLRDFQKAHEKVAVLRKKKEHLETQIANIIRQLRQTRKNILLQQT